MEVKEKEILLDNDALKAISKEVAPTVAEAVGEQVKQLFEQQAADAAKALEASEKTVKKAVNEPSDVKVKSSIDELPKEIRLIRAINAMKSGDYKTLREFNKRALDRRDKAGYANSTVDADGGYVVADPEFEAEIETLSNEYGVALRDADIRQINSDSVKTNKRGSNVSMYEVTTEGGAKQGTKLTITQETVTLREFAAIAVATNRLVDDAAIDFWASATQGFAEENARIIDDMVFTDTNSTYPGIIHTDGIGVETVGAAITSITWDDLLNAEAKIPTKARANMKHYMHRSIWNLLLQVKDSEGRYQFTPALGLQTPWGTPVVLSDALPASTVVGDANEGYVITGDLKRATLYRKRGLELSFSNEATVADANGNSVNLWQKNMQALKAEMRAVVLVKFPEAFTVTGTGTVS